MRRMGWKQFFQRLKSEQGGATAIEYGLIAALIFLAIVVSINSFSSEMGNMFNTISNALQGAF